MQRGYYRWLSLENNDKNELELIYRIYETQLTQLIRDGHSRLTSVAIAKTFSYAPRFHAF